MERVPRGALATPGDYSVTLAKRHNGQLVELSGPRSFTVKPLPQSPETSDDPDAVQAFHRKAGELYGAVQGAVAHAAELGNRVDHLKSAIPATNAAAEDDEQSLRQIESRLADVSVALHGDSSVASRNEPVAWSIAQRSSIVYQWLLDTRSPVPGQFEDSYAIAAAEFEVALRELRAISSELSALESRMESLGAPWTPGRTPDWSSN